VGRKSSKLLQWAVPSHANVPERRMENTFIWSGLKAFESANAAVDNVISQWLKGSGSRKRIKYIIYNP